VKSIYNRTRRLSPVEEQFRSIDYTLSHYHKNPTKMQTQNLNQNKRTKEV